MVNFVPKQVYSASPEDLIEGKSHPSTDPYKTTLPVTVTSPPEEIGMGPYILIGVMVVLVAVVGAITLFGIKKKKKTEK